MRVFIFCLLLFIVPLSADYTEIKFTANFLFQIHPSAECNAIAEILMESFKNLSPKDSKKTAEERYFLIIEIQKECESRNYDLNCLKSVKNIADINVCKK